VGALAACLVEPIPSSGAVIEPPPGSIPALTRRCEEPGMLLIVDEAQTGLCGIGNRYAFDGGGAVPDIVTLSKALGAGVPLAVVVTGAEIGRAHTSGVTVLRDPRLLPAVAAVGNTELDVLQPEPLGRPGSGIRRTAAVRTAGDSGSARGGR
jgi:2,2-dialkylglycine decarboxylase (pyruvate)